MNLKSLFSPLAVALLLGASAAPVSAAVTARVDGKLITPHHQATSLAALTPAQRTQLQDQCRQKQADADNNVSGDDFGAATPALCDAIGIPAA